MKLKRIPTIILSIIGLAILAGSILLFNYVKRINAYQEAVQNISYQPIDLKNIPDGSYIGECNVDVIFAKVEVKMKNGRIETINILEHRQERGSNAEIVLSRIIQEQNIDVDTVTKATNSSKVLKKAVENSLIK